jgi:hypothetical protein
VQRYWCAARRNTPPSTRCCTSTRIRPATLVPSWRGSRKFDFLWDGAEATPAERVQQRLHHSWSRHAHIATEGGQNKAVRKRLQAVQSTTNNFVGDIILIWLLFPLKIAKKHNERKCLFWDKEINEVIYAETKKFVNIISYRAYN